MINPFVSESRTMIHLMGHPCFHPRYETTPTHSLSQLAVKKGGIARNTLLEASSNLCLPSKMRYGWHIRANPFLRFRLCAFYPCSFVNAWVSPMASSTSPCSRTASGDGFTIIFFPRLIATILILYLLRTSLSFNDFPIRYLGALI